MRNEGVIPYEISFAEGLVEHAKEGNLIYAEELLDHRLDIYEFSKDDLYLIALEVLSLRHPKITSIVLTSTINPEVGIFEERVLVRGTEDGYNIKVVFSRIEQAQSLAEFYIVTKVKLLEGLVRFLYEYLDIPSDFLT